MWRRSTKSRRASSKMRGRPATLIGRRRRSYCSCCGSGMYSTYSANKQRRYRYYVCYRSQQKLEGYCTTRAVSAPSVEEAVVESIRRVGVDSDVLAETA